MRKRPIGYLPGTAGGNDDGSLDKRRSSGARDIGRPTKWKATCHGKSGNVEMKRRGGRRGEGGGRRKEGGGGGRGVGAGGKARRRMPAGVSSEHQAAEGRNFYSSEHITV